MPGGIVWWRLKIGSSTVSNNRIIGFFTLRLWLGSQTSFKVAEAHIHLMFVVLMFPLSGIEEELVDFWRVWNFFPLSWFLQQTRYCFFFLKALQSPLSFCLLIVVFLSVYYFNPRTLSGLSRWEDFLQFFFLYNL